MKKAAMGLAEWIGRVNQTRAYGITYIPVASRGGLVVFNAVEFGWSWYGRSQQGGGHKHKAWARWVEAGKPVPSRMLSRLLSTVTHVPCRWGGR